MGNQQTSTKQKEDIVCEKSETIPAPSSPIKCVTKLPEYHKNFKTNDLFLNLPDLQEIDQCCVCFSKKQSIHNLLVYCDWKDCTVAIHRACYGTLPSKWLCGRCESRASALKVECKLCPNFDGALKRTDDGGWAHILCALYTPEARFANVNSCDETIILNMIPRNRFNKICYICEEKGNLSKSKVGICIRCNKTDCNRFFHVTCAHSEGLFNDQVSEYKENLCFCQEHSQNRINGLLCIEAMPPTGNCPTTLTSNLDEEHHTITTDLTSRTSELPDSLGAKLQEDEFQHRILSTFCALQDAINCIDDELDVSKRQKLVEIDDRPLIGMSQTFSVDEVSLETEDEEEITILEANPGPSQLRVADNNSVEEIDKNLVNPDKVDQAPHSLNSDPPSSPKEHKSPLFHPNKRRRSSSSGSSTVPNSENSDEEDVHLNELPKRTKKITREELERIVMDNMVGFISSYGPLTTIENKMETCSDELKLARRKVAELTREVTSLRNVIKSMVTQIQLGKMPSATRVVRSVGIQVQPKIERNPKTISISAISTPTMESSDEDIAEVTVISDSVSSSSKNQHCPLPSLPSAPASSDDSLPPQPILQVSKIADTLMISWNLSDQLRNAYIASYEVWMLEETIGRPNPTNQWKCISNDVKALTLPMACRIPMTAPTSGQTYLSRYHFAVRATDMHGRFGPFSNVTCTSYP